MSRTSKTVSSANMFVCDQCGTPFYLSSEQCHHASHIRHTCGSCGKTTDIDSNAGSAVPNPEAFVHSMIDRLALALGIAIGLPIIACAIIGNCSLRNIEKQLRRS